MLAAVIYLVVILWLVYKTAFFGLFNDEIISRKTFAYVFLFKVAAIPVFYLVYATNYGGLEKYDAGIFYNDAKVISEFAYGNFTEYLKLLFGLQNDSEGSYIYNHCLVNTNNWDNGKIRDFFYNDNRVVIRLHSVFHFIAFGSYYVHALFNCFFSFIGIVFLYKSFREFFLQKELLLLLVFCFFPTLWFYTGAVLKEGIALFVLGCSLYALKKIIYRQGSLKNFIFLIVLVLVSCFLKPYLLLWAQACFGVFFMLHRWQRPYKVLLFVSGIVLLAVLANGLSLLVKHKSLTKAALARQRIFADAAKGGIFLLDSVKFVRLEYDSALVQKADAGHYTIKKNVPYIYWEHTHQQDTLFCAGNTDTLTRYKLVYQLRESGSNVNLSVYSGSLAKVIGVCLYYSLFQPFFAGIKSPLLLVASLENLLIVISLVFIIIGFIRNKKDAFPPFAFVCVALGLCILVGLTTPNSGAIFRYRSPAVIFILAAALYYISQLKYRFYKRHG